VVILESCRDSEDNALPPRYSEDIGVKGIKIREAERRSSALSSSINKVRICHRCKAHCASDENCCLAIMKGSISLPQGELGDVKSSIVGVVIN